MIGGEREIIQGKYGNVKENKVESIELSLRDPLVARVCKRIAERSNLGFDKYGRTLDFERRGGFKDLEGYLNDIQEELMDAILYIQAAREQIADLNQEYKKMVENGEA